jgi:hypothetical protein
MLSSPNEGLWVPLDKEKGVVKGKDILSGA